MARKDNPITGDSTRVEILFNGVPQNVTNMVQRFNAKPKFTVVETMHLGTTAVDVDRTPSGWEGDMTVSRKTGQLDDLMDAIDLALRNNVPLVIAITQTDIFRDGTSRSHVYPDCQLDFDDSRQRGQAATCVVKWSCGVARI